MSGEVKLVKAVDGGAEPRPSLKISLGDTVCVDDAAPLTAVKVLVASQGTSPEPSKWPRWKSIVSRAVTSVRSCSCLVLPNASLPVIAGLFGFVC